MTTPTILFGWLLLGLGLIAIGALFVVMTCSAWSESRARKAKRIVTGRLSWLERRRVARARADLASSEQVAKFAHALTDGSDEFRASWEQHVADALAKTEESNVVRLQSVPAPVIPIQRDRRGGASRG